MRIRTSGQQHLMTPLLGLMVVALPSTALAAQYPTVTVEDTIVECRAPAVSVQMDISIEDNDDPLPRIILDNAFNDANPDNYPLGNHEVYVGGCDEAVTASQMLYDLWPSYQFEIHSLPTFVSPTILITVLSQEMYYAANAMPLAATL